MKELEAKKIVCEAGRKLVKEGLVARTWGNISARVDKNSFAITPSGRTYENLTPADIVLVKIDDLSYDGTIKPSSEKGLHAEAYKLRDDTNAVIHTHQMNASTIAAARREVPVTQKNLIKILGPSVRLASYALPGTKKLKLAAAKALKGRNAALLANHGAVCIGTDMNQAFIVAQTLEKVCQQFIEQQFLNQTKKQSKFKNQLMHQSYLEKFSKKPVLDNTETKKDLIDWGKKLLQEGIVSQNSCLSCRAGETMIITPLGGTLITLKPENLIQINLNDLSHNQNLKPSQEYIIHSAIYNKRKEFNTIIHSDQENIITSSKAGRTIYPLLDDFAQLVGPTAKIAPYTLPTDASTVKSILKALKRRNAVLLSNNGAICAGTDFDDAHAVCQVMEKGCKSFIETEYLGGGIKINAIEANLMRIVYKLKYSKKEKTNK